MVQEPIVFVLVGISSCIIVHLKRFIYYGIVNNHILSGVLHWGCFTGGRITSLFLNIIVFWLHWITIDFKC